MTKTRYLLLLLSVFTLVLLSACGASAGSTKDKVTKVIVGTGTQFPNVCFIDKDGKLTGYMMSNLCVKLINVFPTMTSSSKQWISLT